MKYLIKTIGVIVILIGAFIAMINFQKNFAFSTLIISLGLLIYKPYYDDVKTKIESSFVESRFLNSWIIFWHYFKGVLVTFFLFILFFKLLDLRDVLREDFNIDISSLAIIITALSIYPPIFLYEKYKEKKRVIAIERLDEIFINIAKNVNLKKRDGDEIRDLISILSFYTTKDKKAKKRITEKYVNMTSFDSLLEDSGYIYRENKALKTTENFKTLYTNKS